MDGAGAATAIVAKRESRSTLESMAMKYRENVKKIMRTCEGKKKSTGPKELLAEKKRGKIDSHPEG